MAYELRWIVENHLLLVDMNGAITVEEADLITHHTYRVMEDAPGDNMIHVVNNVAEATIGSQHIAYAKLNPPKTTRGGWVIIVGDQKLVSLAIQLILRLLDSQMKYLSSIDEAIAFIAARDIAVQQGLKSEPTWQLQQPIA
jgi:hypothetical protein